MTTQADLNKVLALAPNETCTVNWFEGGGGEVERTADALVLREVGAYGTAYLSEYTFALQEAAELVALAHTWT